MEEKLNKILLKPRFSIEVTEDKKTIIQKFKDKLKAQDCKYHSKISDDHIFIDLPQEEQKIWSPQLEVVIEEKDNGSLIRGLFAPKPSMWTLFIFLHFVDATFFLIALSIYYANSVMGNSNTIWIIAMIACVVAWGLLYIIGQMGKKKSKEQIDGLKKFLIQNLEKLNIH
ncbi:MAG: hypothetical protein R2798_09685 [Chitinophagales bacterium]|nr:GTP-binding protein [Bacteroidota bacterium]